MNRLIVIIGLLALSLPTARADEVMIDAESFADIGGWVIDQQSMDQMGSPYLMAHGLGEKVKDAKTKVQISKGGKHRVWVRTRDWVGKWKGDEYTGAMKASGSPGVFQLVIDEQPLKPLFGEHGAEWHWQDGGSIELTAGAHSLSLRDLTGFNGRCDVIMLTDKLKSGRMKNA